MRRSQSSQTLAVFRKEPTAQFCIPKVVRAEHSLKPPGDFAPIPVSSVPLVRRRRHRHANFALQRQRAAKEDSPPRVPLCEKVVKVTDENKKEKASPCKVNLKASVVCFKSPRGARKKTVFAISPSRIELAPNSKLKQKKDFLTN